MILTCPQCATRYLLSDEKRLATAGQTVRCTKCQTSWFVSSDFDELALKDNQQAESALMEAPPPDPHKPSLSTPNKDISNKDGNASVEFEGGTNTGAERSSDPTFAPNKLGAHVLMRDRVDRKRRNFRLAVVGSIWGVTLGLISLIALFAYLARQDIIERFPQTGTLYKAFNVEVSKQGLVFDNPVSRSVFINGNPVLVINGRVKNISTRKMPLPMVKLSLHNNSEELLAEWRVEFDKADLEKGKRAEFVAQFPNPPVDATYLRYGFDDGNALDFSQSPMTTTDESLGVENSGDDIVNSEGQENSPDSGDKPVETEDLPKANANQNKPISQGKPKPQRDPIPMIVEE